MPAPGDDRTDGDLEQTVGFSRRVVVVFAVQFATLAALYWFGRHFS